jgi:NitT/TauT family transport system permease protein
MTGSPTSRSLPAPVGRRVEGSEPSPAGLARVIRFLGSRNGLRILSVIAIFGAWQAVSAFAGEDVIPSPGIVLARIGQLFGTGEVWRNASATIWRVYLGYGASFLLAVGLGLVVGFRHRAEWFFDVPLVVLMAIPSLAWSLIALMALGLTEFAVMFVIGAIAFPSMVINVSEGVRNIDKDLLQMAGSFHAPRRRVLRDITFPSIFPFILVGARYGLANAWKIALIAEMLGMPSGVGYALRYNYSIWRMDLVLAWTAIYVVIIVFVDRVILRSIERRVMSWRPEVAR